MRKTCLNCVYDLARDDERIYFIGSDLGQGTLDNFKREMPRRFFMEGVSEQHIIGMASGLAMEGNIPYVNTIGVFITRRCFEQIALDVCLNNLKVRLIGNGGGLVYAPLGPSHLAVDDIAIMRVLPNMTILAPADANEMRILMGKTAGHDGPIYIRLAKGGDPVVTRDTDRREIGKAVAVRDGKDALIVTTGITLQIAMEAAEALDAKGISAGILHCHTVKPLDAEAVLRRSSAVPAVVTVEEGTIAGGLGSSVAEILAESNTGQAPAFQRIGLPDAYCENFGSQALLLERFGVTAEKIAGSITGLLESR